MKNYQYRDLFEYEIIWSGRKTLAISIEPGGRIIVRSPLEFTQKNIEFYLEEKEKWIRKHLAYMIEQGKKIFTRNYIDGEKFLFRGKTYLLKIKDNEICMKPSAYIHDSSLIVEGVGRNTDLIQYVLKQFYIMAAQEHILEKVNFYSDIIEVNPAKITIRDTKSRWGSCSSKGNIMINWRIIMAPDDILDYIIVHELCHMIEMNHSKRFWFLVEQIIPDWKASRLWLKQNGSMLVV